MFRAPILLIVLSLWRAASAQVSLQNNNWMFGGTNVGPNVPQTPGPSLNFTNCSPNVQNNSPGVQFEGQSAISDSQTGALLFYTSGSQVRNASGQIMTNGNLVATSSSMAQNLIVKKPGSNTIYYLFTPETQAGSIISTVNPGLNGFSYSVIDMSLSGGLGAVVSFGNLLQPFQNCEMVTGVYHDNGQDIWIIGHKYGSNTFFVYLLTANGINPTPVLSSVGPTLFTSGTSVYANSKYDAIGELKAAPNGTKLAFTTFYNGFTCLFDFDKTNGVISNPIPLSLGSAGYGTSFSPDNTKLYFSRVDPSQGGVSFLGNGSIVQFDISSNSQATIQASMYVVFTSTTGFRSLKLGLDGKLYAARTTLVGSGNGASYLAVINNPNQAGAGCNFVNDGVFIGVNKGRWGLNNVIEDFYTCSTFNFNLGPDVVKCPTSTVTLTAPANQTSYLWNTQATTQSITITQPGTYWVTVTGPNGVGTDTIFVSNFTVGNLSISGNSNLCPGSQTLLSASNNFTNYLWNNGIQTQNNLVGEGSYSVTALDTNGCLASAAFNVFQYAVSAITISGDTIVCPGSLTQLSAAPTFTNYLWNNGIQAQNNLVGPGSYLVSANDANGCLATGTFDVFQYPVSALAISGDTIVCPGSLTQLSATPTFTNYLWNNSTQTQSNFVGVGSYSVTALDTNGCLVTQIATVSEFPIAILNISGDTAICTNQTSLLEATPGFATYSWSDGQTAPIVSLGAGSYILTAIDSVGCQVTQEITITSSAPTAQITASGNFVNPNYPIQFQSSSIANLFPISSWSWDFGDGTYSNQENPSHNYLQNSIYYVSLVVTDALGCTDSATYLLEFAPEFVYYIPNTFTPDDNAFNQQFLPIFSIEVDAFNYQLSIYNRWGELVFESRDPSEGWDGSFGLDGKSCQAGTYTYVVTFSVPSLYEQQIINGHVNLIK